MGRLIRRSFQDETTELALFALKKHGAGAAFYARSRATMFEKAGDVADAARWRAIATRVEALPDCNVVRLRPDSDDRGASDTGVAAPPRAKAEPRRTEPEWQSAYVATVEAALRLTRSRIVRQEALVRGQERAGETAGTAGILLAEMIASERLWTVHVEVVRRSISDADRFQAAVRGSRDAIAAARVMLASTGEAPTAASPPRLRILAPS